MRNRKKNLYSYGNKSVDSARLDLKKLNDLIAPVNNGLL